ncbi:MAG: DnaA regulatory inactivator Hda [Betaproteobacteria bacterium]|nr:DnaA regulatory inactivator Hda [Betaproteobacteria bacterium]
MKQLVLDLIPAPAPSFDNFAAGRNAEALAALESAARGECPAKVIFLWGAPGAGKSHCARSLAVQPEWTADIHSGADALVVVDDAQLLTEAAQQDLFNLINLQQSARGCVVATGPVAPRDLPLRRDLASRLGSGLVFQLHPLSDTEKSAALMAHARSRGFALREDVLHYLLRHARRDMPSLMSFLDALDRHSLETGREITVPMVRDMMQPTLAFASHP